MATRKFELPWVAAEEEPKVKTEPAPFVVPIKCCDTCVHQRVGTGYSSPENAREFAKCALFQTFCSVAVTHHCTFDFKRWQSKIPLPSLPKPPRRSLRRWIYDTFLA
jgi:hypothetical protein